MTEVRTQGDGQRTRHRALVATPALAGFDDIRMLSGFIEDAAAAASGILVDVVTTA